MLFKKSTSKKEDVKKKKAEPRESLEKNEAPEKSASENATNVLSEKEVKERLAEGWLRALITFELVGKPREHIEQTLRAYLMNIKQDSRIGPISEEYADAIATEDGLFSTFCEFEAVVKDLEVLTWLAINFMPASIEILEPERVNLEVRHITNWLNDLLAKLHEVSNVVREERAVNKHLTEGMNALIKNAILLALKNGARTEKELEGDTGVLAQQLEPFLKHLVKKEQIIERDGTYALP